MEERATYREIRGWFLGCYYSYCKSKIRDNSPWVEGEIEAGYAYNELENSFDSSIEKLMLEVVALILGGGRYTPASQGYHRDVICTLLEEVKASGLLDSLPVDEVEELKADLRILSII